MPRNPDDGQWLEQACAAAAELPDRLRAHPVARVRNCRFSVFLCRWQMRPDAHIVALGVPAGLNFRAFNVLYRDLLGGYDAVTLDEGSLNDVNGVPQFRYESGTKIAYVGAGDHSPARPPDFEWRSFELYRPASRSRNLSWGLPTVRWGTPERHSLSAWAVLRRDVLRFFFEIERPSTYAHLKRSITSQFGVSVREVPRTRIGHHGRIRVDWLTDDEGTCGVDIEIARELPAPLKYVVLAHEMAHYALHFPLLVAAQAVEQRAWIEPDLELLFGRTVEQLLGERMELEESADDLASFAVLPRWYDHDFNLIWDVDRTPSSDQMKWGGLQDFFPVTREGSDFRMHRTRPRMLGRERDDLLRAGSAAAETPRDLYDVVLAASLRRGSPEATARNHRVEAAIAKIVETVSELEALSLVAAVAGLDARQDAILTEFSGDRQVNPPMSSSVDGRPAMRWPELRPPGWCVAGPAGEGRGVDA